MPGKRGRGPSKGSRSGAATRATKGAKAAKATKTARATKAASPRAAIPELREGQAAPDVTLWDQDGKERKLSDFRGKSLVLYFYPKDFTSGCTTEACQFQAALPAYEGLDAVVLGVSPDDAESHRKFRAKHGLQFPLAFDPSRKALEAFGVWKEKDMYGRKFMGVERSTFLVGPDGVVRAAWRKVKPDGHARQVLEALRSLAKEQAG